MPDTPAVTPDVQRLEKIESLITDGQKKAAEETAAASKWRADADVRLSRLEKASATQTVSTANPKIQFAPIVRGVTTGQWDGFEKVRDEGIEAAKHRDMSVTSGSAGGYITPFFYQPEIIDLLTAQSHLHMMGVRQITGLRGQSRKLPRLTSGAVFSYFAENSGPSGTQPVFDQEEVKPHQAGAKVVMSRLLAENADPAAEQVVRNILTRFGALFFDTTGLYGSGQGNEPAGLVNQGVAGDSLDAAITLDKCMDAITEVESANGIVNPATTCFLMHPRDWGKLRKEKAAVTGTYQLSAPGSVGQRVQPTLLGYPVHLSTQVTGDGGTEDDTCVFFGDWSQLWHCIWSDFVVESSREGTYYDNHQVAVKTVFCDDWLLAQPSSFFVWTNVHAS